MVSGVIPLLYIGMQAVVESMQAVQPLTLNSELPLAFMDGLSRAYLLCNLIPPAVLTSSSTTISTSPWTLLLTALVRGPARALKRQWTYARVSDNSECWIFLRQHVLLPPTVCSFAHHAL